MATTNTPFAPTAGPVSNVLEQRRISRRLLRLRVPVNVSFRDKLGRQFVDKAKTELVSAWGATVECSYPLSWGQEVFVSFANKEVLARIVGQTGIGSGSHSYGICFLQEDKQFWGVSFPKLEAVEHESLLLECNRCGQSLTAEINDIEVLVLLANRLLLMRCPVCNDTGQWRRAESSTGLEQVPDIQRYSDRERNQLKRGVETFDQNPDLVSIASIHDAEMFRPAPRPERRRHKRVSLPTAKACIERPDTEPDVAEVVNISKSGACIRSTIFYPIGSWIRIACPYTIGGSNIFQSGRVVRIATFGELREYGVEYVRLV